MDRARYSIRAVPTQWAIAALRRNKLFRIHVKIRVCTNKSNNIITINHLRWWLSLPTRRGLDSRVRITRVMRVRAFIRLKLCTVKSRVPLVIRRSIGARRTGAQQTVTGERKRKTGVGRA